MKIKNISLRNFRGHKSLNIEFNDNLTVIAGENGAGKSSILDAISLGISWIVAKTRSLSGRGATIKLNDINIDHKEAIVSCEFDDVEFITLSGKNIGGKVKQSNTSNETLRNYSAIVESNISNNIAQNLPVFVHYGVRRAVIDIPLRIRSKSHDSIFETYDDWNKGGANFKSFFEWFRNQEDIENEKLRYWNKGSLFDLFIEDNLNREQTQFQPDRELSTVRHALQSFMPDYNNARVSRRPLRMLIDKGSDTLNVEQLSDGEKIYFALIGDLCRRLVLANPIMEDPLQGEGIVLIDEVDLHLHPNWQKDIAVRLTEVFPNIQFIITTHSPLVLTNVPTGSVRFLKDNEVLSTTSLYGLPASIILKDKMGLKNELPLEVETLISEITKYIDSKDLNEAQAAYDKLKELTPDHPELVRFEFFINRLKMR
ncbi:MAG: AAA family ATPase [Rikenellaceae bacterium]